MRTMLSLSLLSAALFGTACKNDTEKAADKVEKAQENVRDEQKDVAQELNKDNPSAADVHDEKKDVVEAKGDLAQARAEFRTEMTTRLANVDKKITELEARTDAKAKENAAALRVRRNELSTKLDKSGDEAESTWNNFATGTKDTFSQLEKDLDAAF